MSEQTIDTLNIEIQSKAQQSSSGMDKLITSIEKLKSATSGGIGNLTGIAASLNKLTSTIDGMKGKSGSVTSLVSSIQKLNDAKTDRLSSNINTLTESLKALSGMDPELNAVISDLAALSRSGSGSTAENALKLQAEAAKAQATIDKSALTSAKAQEGLKAIADKNAQIEESARAAAAQEQELADSINHAIQQHIVQNGSVAAFPNMAADMGAVTPDYEEEKTVLTQAALNGPHTSYNIEDSIKSLKTAVGETGAAASSAMNEVASGSSKASGFVDRLKQSFDSLREKTLNLGNTAKEAYKQLNSGQSPSLLDRLSNAAKNAAASVGEIGKQSQSSSAWMQRMVAHMLIGTAIYRGITAFTQAVKTGMQDISQSTSSANLAMSALSTSSLYLKDSIAASLLPALQALVPVISTVANWLAGLFNTIGMLTARIFGGATTITVAKQAGVNYAETIGKATKSTGDGTKALKDQTKALKDQKNALDNSISGFDELNIIQQDSSSTGNAGSGNSVKSTGGGASAGMPSYGDMFQQEKIPGSLSELGDKIKAEMDKWAQYAQPTIDAFNRLVKALNPLKTFAAKGIEDFYNDFLVPIGRWVLGTGLPEFLDITTKLIKEVNWAQLNKALDNLWKSLVPFGKAIGQGLLNFYKDLLVPIAAWTLGTGLPQFLEIMSSLLNKINWNMLNAALDSVWKALVPFAENVGGGLLWFFQNVISPLVQWAANDAIPAALDLVSNAIKVINSVVEALKPTGQWLFDSFLKPLAAWTGDTVVSALAAVSNALSNISNWVNSNKCVVEGMTKTVLAFFAAWEATKVLAFIEISGGLVGALQAITAATVGATAAKLADKAETIALTVLYAKDFLASIVSGTAALAKQAAQWAVLAALKVADVIKTTAQTVATNLATVAQTALNFVLNANPIGIVITLVAGLVTGLVLLYNKNEWFRNGWNTVWSGIVAGFKKFVNLIISGLNGLIDGINFVINALDKIHFDVPDWVPLVGGQSIGVDIPEASHIPYLATGDVIYKPTVAEMGEYPDASSNPEVVAPQSIIRETVDESNEGVITVLSQILEAAEKIAAKDNNTYLDGEKITKNVNKRNANHGYNLGPQST